MLTPLLKKFQAKYYMSGNTNNKKWPVDMI